jgi:hypothetical protein
VSLGRGLRELSLSDPRAISEQFSELQRGNVCGVSCLFQLKRTRPARSCRYCLSCSWSGPAATLRARDTGDEGAILGDDNVVSDSSSMQLAGKLGRYVSPYRSITLGKYQN